MTIRVRYNFFLLLPGGITVPAHLNFDQGVVKNIIKKHFLQLPDFDEGIKKVCLVQLCGSVAARMFLNDVSDEGLLFSDHCCVLVVLCSPITISICWFLLISSLWSFWWEMGRITAMLWSASIVTRTMAWLCRLNLNIVVSCQCENSTLFFFPRFLPCTCVETCVLLQYSNDSHSYTSLDWMASVRVMCMMWPDLALVWWHVRVLFFSCRKCMSDSVGSPVHYMQSRSYVHGWYWTAYRAWTAHSGLDCLLSPTWHCMYCFWGKSYKMSV